jgi:transposase
MLDKYLEVMLYLSCEATQSYELLFRETTKEEQMSAPIEGQEYFSIDEAAKATGWNRATVFEWVKTLDIKTYKFVRNRKTYLAAADVDRLKEIKAKPWTAGEKKEEPAV